MGTLSRHYPYRTDKKTVKIIRTKLLQCFLSWVAQSSRLTTRLQTSWKIISINNIGNLHHASNTIIRGHPSKVHRRNCLRLKAQINSSAAVLSSIQGEFKLSEIVRWCSETSMSQYRTKRYPYRSKWWYKHQNLLFNNLSLSGKQSNLLDPSKEFKNPHQGLSRLKVCWLCGDQAMRGLLEEKILHP